MGFVRRLFLDLDGCGLGLVWPPPWKPVCRSVWAAILGLCADQDVYIHVLSNRPPGQLPLFATLAGGGANFHLAESGLSAWIPSENRYLVNPKYEDFSDTVRPRVMALIERKHRPSWRGPIFVEAGNKQVSICVFPIPFGGQPPELCVESLAEDLRRDPEMPAEAEVKVGGGVDIFPKGASKRDALEWVPKLNACYNPGDGLAWEQCLYVDDSMTGREAAEYLAEQGGVVAAPGNARSDYQAVVRNCGGWVAEAEYEAGVLEALRRWLE